MESRWNTEEAARHSDALALRCYSSRLLGADPALVLHGGGNTSVKLGDTLFVKGSGSDLATVTPSDFTSLRLPELQALLEGDALDSARMYERLDRLIALRPAPKPSVETLLHAALPPRYVEHTHADAVLAVANTEHGERILADLYGDLAPTVPYRHSGFDLAQACAAAYRERATARTIGLVLQFHGVVAFADDARASYENMIRLVAMAESYLDARGAWTLPAAMGAAPSFDRLALARLRAAISRAAGFPLVMRVMRDPFARHFAARTDLDELCNHGPATPQHAVFGRRLPLLGGDVPRFVARNRDYLARALAPSEAERADPTPRIAVLPEIGVCALGVSGAYARIAAEVFRHDMEIMVRAQAHDRYRAAPPHLMARAELEYGGFEARERELATSRRPLLGQVAAITAAAFEAAPRQVESLVHEGCAVAIAGPAPRGVAADDAWRCFPVAADTPAAWNGFLDEAVLAFGGLDLLVIEPGETQPQERSAALLALSPVGGRVECVDAPIRVAP